MLADDERGRIAAAKAQRDIGARRRARAPAALRVAENAVGLVGFRQRFQLGIVQLHL
jgi:hypothetical protein